MNNTYSPSKAGFFSEDEKFQNWIKFCLAGIRNYPSEAPTLFVRLVLMDAVPRNRSTLPPTTFYDLVGSFRNFYFSSKHFETRFHYSQFFL